MITQNMISVARPEEVLQFAYLHGWRFLEENSHSLESLVNSVKNSREDKTIKVVQWLIDNEKLAYNKENKLMWHS